METIEESFDLHRVRPQPGESDTDHGSRPPSSTEAMDDHAVPGDERIEDRLRGHVHRSLLSRGIRWEPTSEMIEEM